MIVARGVSRRYGASVALQPVDFELGAGEVVALVGPNGAGKSTLLALLAGALEPSSGEVERRVAVGWAPQRPSLYTRLTPREHLDLFARLSGKPERTASSLPERPVGDLSVGQRQRLNLALAFLGDPPAVLLDEPSASLDAERRAELWGRLERLRAEGGAAVVATQVADEVDRADRVVRLDGGRLAA